MELNKIHHANFLTNDLPDKSVNLIIADPPYFEVKGSFDFIWASFEDYLKDVEIWAKECKRVLADNGTLLWYGHAKKIAYAQIIFDKYFNLENNLVWNKGNFMGLESSEGLRSFAPCTERILMYSTEIDISSLDMVFFDKNNFSSIKKYLKDEKQKIMSHYNFTSKQFNDYTLNLGCSTTPYKNWFCNTGFWEMATKKMYEKLQKSGFFQKEYEELRKEYEELRKEYEHLRRPFQNEFRLNEVLEFSNESARSSTNYDHDTVKPETLTRALILTCSRPNDLVLVPFSGSGTECAMSAKEGRRFIGFDIEKKYVDIGNKRVQNILSKPTLF